MKKLFLVIFFVVAFFVMCGEYDSKVKVTKNNSNQENPEIEDNSQDNTTIASVGDSVEIDGLKITANSADTEFTDYEDEYGLYKLENGLKYIKVSFTYENLNNSEKYVSIYDYDCYADGTLCEQTYNFGGDFINANISSGRNVSFDTYYIVPVNAQSIELEYKELISFDDDKIIIKVQ